MLCAEQTSVLVMFLGNVCSKSRQESSDTHEFRHRLAACMADMQKSLTGLLACRPDGPEHTGVHQADSSAAVTFPSHWFHMQRIHLL